MGSPSVSESSVTAPNAGDSELEQTQTEEEDLPPGWEKHEGKGLVQIYLAFAYCFLFLVDDDGPYYWHIKSGTIQREPPENKESANQPAMNFQRQIVQEAEVVRTKLLLLV